MARPRWLIPALWLALLAFGFQGSRGIWEPDEGRYVNVAVQMLASGDWLVPRSDAERPHLTKPPLTYWSIAASIKLFGSNEWAVRAPNALAFVLTGLLVIALARAFGLARPELAGAIWATSLLPLVASHTVNTDTLLALFETAAMAGFVYWWMHGARRGLWWMWLAFGAAFMTKGPPGLLPLLALLSLMAWQRGWRGVRALFPPWPVLAFLVLALWWFLLLVWRNPEWLRYFLMEETVERIASHAHNRNPGWRGLFEVMGVTLLAGALPWTVLLFYSYLRRSRPIENAASVTPPLAIVPDPGEYSPLWRQRLLVCWMLLPLAVFCLSQSRLHLYLLPLVVPYALWLAVRFEGPRGVSERAVTWIAVVAGVALLGLKAYASTLTHTRDARAYSSVLARQVRLEDYRKLVFIDQSPRYGLSFYTALPVGEVRSRGSEAGGRMAARPRELCAELGRGERALFLARSATHIATQQQAMACGYRLQTLGAAGENLLYDSAVLK